MILSLSERSIKLYDFKLDDVEAWKLVGRYASVKAARKGHKEVLQKIEKATTENKDPFEILPDLQPWDE